ncbi:PepSY-associated TM helix domain-containing protein [Methylomonas sp. CM2]|uniref:PepSY-associated TM helix domain-containing protein n=1 Tax=Methylomonas sp. CM2 TaxID=3417647 RepID=UPI003CE9DA9B
MNSPASAVTAAPVNANAKRTARLEGLKARRKLWLKVHLWLGLSLGLFLALIGLTGSVLVFWQEIDRALNPALYVSARAGGDHQSLDSIFAAAERVAPPAWESAWADAPTAANGNYVFGFYYPSGSQSPESAQSLNIAIDPYTAEPAGRRVFYHASNPLKHSLMGFFFKLHYALLLGDTGVTVVGIFGVLFLVSVLSGLILWWPLTGKWRRVLTIKRRASRERFNHDLHQSAGFYSLAVMLALLVSGIYFNLPEQFRWLVGQFSELSPEPPMPAHASPGQAGALDRAIERARRDFPGGVAQYYTWEGGTHRRFQACYRDVESLRYKVVNDRCLVFDPASGELLQVQDAEHGSAGDVFMLWQWPLHSGRVFGWTGRILVFVTGLLCPLLFATGLIRWLQKRKSAKAKLRARIA